MSRSCDCVAVLLTKPYVCIISWKDLTTCAIVRLCLRLLLSGNIVMQCRCRLRLAAALCNHSLQTVFALQCSWMALSTRDANLATISSICRCEAHRQTPFEPQRVAVLRRRHQDIRRYTKCMVVHMTARIVTVCRHHCACGWLRTIII